MAETNQITYTDLVKPTDSITQAIAQMTQLEASYSGMLDKVKKDATDIEKSIKKVSGATEEQQDIIKKGATEVDKLTKAQERLKESRSNNAIELAKLKQIQAEQNRISKLEIKLNRSKEGSYDKLSAQYSLNKIRLNQMSKEQRSSTDSGRLLEQQTKDLYEEMNNLQEATGKHTLKVGDYKNQLSEAISEQEVFGTSLSKIGATFSSTAGLIGAGVAVVVGLGKAYASSARGAADLARVSDRLDSILKGLGNTLADAGGEVGILDGLLAEIQTRVLGYGYTLRSTIEVNVRESLRQLEIEEIEQERLKKNQLERAEIFRQVRDEERNDIETRRQANVDLGKVIDKREEKSLQFQESRINKLKILLALDEGNLEIQQQIKQVEFEMADIREEAAGYRSEQYANDLALSREVSENSLSLLEETTRAELLSAEEGTAERLELEKNLVRERLKLELQAAGQNRQLQDIAQQKALNDIVVLQNAFDAFQEAKTDKEKKEKAKRDALEEKNRAKLKADAEKDRKDRAAKAKLEYDSQMSLYSEQKAFSESEIELLKKTENEKTKLRLKAEKDRLSKVLDLNKTSVAQLSELQIKTIENQIKNIDNLISQADSQNGNDIYSLAGINLSDEAKSAISTSTAFAIDQVMQFMDAKVRAADLAVENSDREVSAAENALNREIQLASTGYASSVTQAQKELALAKSNQEKALKEQEKAQKEQEKIQTLQQVSSLVTASAMIWGQLGFPFAIPALAVMFGSFAFAKIKSAQLAKQKQYGDGDYSVLQGGSHASGNDIFLGNNNGVDEYAEGGEGRAIFSRKSTRKYSRMLPDIVNSLNKGIFEKKYMRSRDVVGSGLNIVNNQRIDLGSLGDDVSAIKKQGERKYFVDSSGRMIETYKNLKRTYDAN